MNVQHRLTTALQMAFALMWRDPFSVNVNQDLQEMEKHARVGQKQSNEQAAVFRAFSSIRFPHYLIFVTIHRYRRMYNTVMMKTNKLTNLI